LYYGYRTLFLKQKSEKLFVAITKHLRATIGQFLANFSAQFARNLCKLRAIFAQILHFFPAIFFRDCLVADVSTLPDNSMSLDVLLFASVLCGLKFGTALYASLFFHCN